jgi:hypothetical protein
MRKMRPGQSLHITNSHIPSPIQSQNRGICSGFLLKKSILSTHKNILQTSFLLATISLLHFELI